MRFLGSRKKNTSFFIYEKSTNIYFLKTAVNEILEGGEYLKLVESHGQGKQRIENLVT